MKIILEHGGRKRGRWFLFFYFFFLQKWGEFKLTHSRSLTFGWSITLFCQLWEELPLNLAMTFMVPRDEARWLGDISSSAIVRLTFLFFVSEMSPHLRDGLVVFWLDILSWTMNLKDLGDLLTFSLAPPWGSYFWCRIKNIWSWKTIQSKLWFMTKHQVLTQRNVTNCGQSLEFGIMSVAILVCWNEDEKGEADRISKDTKLRVVCFYSNN